MQIWDVSCQRQVQIEGPDASRLVQMMTPRDIGAARVGDCPYLPLTAPDGGIVNNPVMLKLAEERSWLSIADSDVALYALGLATGAGLDVEVSEPDVSPLAVQGPRAEDVVAGLFGEAIRHVGFFRSPAHRRRCRPDHLGTGCDAESDGKAATRWRGGQTIAFDKPPDTG